MDGQELRAPLSNGEGSIADVLAGLAAWHLSTAEALTFSASLPDGCAHAVWIDPPYCSGGYTEAAKRQARGMLTHKVNRRLGWFINDNMGTAGLVWLLRAVALEARRILVDGGPGIRAQWLPVRR
jgi:hypothetical protein